MLSKDHYYWEMIKKYTVAFYHIFDDVHVLRTDKSTGQVIKDIKVPVSYVGKSKLFYLLQRKQSIKETISTTLPRITFLVTSLAPDPTRKESNVNTIQVQLLNDTEDMIYAPVPYNFTVQLSVWAEYTDDMMQIIEQIAPFFRPDFTMLVEEIDELGIKRNISTVLNGVTLDVANEFQEETNRIVAADFDFTIKGYLYPPISDAYIIKMINIRFTDFQDRCLDLAEINITFDELNYNLESNGEFRSTAAISTNAESEIDIEPDPCDTATTWIQRLDTTYWSNAGGNTYGVGTWDGSKWIADGTAYPPIYLVRLNTLFPTPLTWVDGFRPCALRVTTTGVTSNLVIQLLVDPNDDGIFPFVTVAGSGSYIWNSGDILPCDFTVPNGNWDFALLTIQHQTSAFNVTNIEFLIP